MLQTAHSGIGMMTTEMLERLQSQPVQFCGKKQVLAKQANWHAYIFLYNIMCTRKQNPHPVSQWNTKTASKQASKQAISKSTSQANNQSTDQPPDDQTNEGTSQPTNPPANRPTSQPTHQPTDPPANQPTSQPTNPPANRPTSQPTHQPTHQPTSPPTNPPANRRSCMAKPQSSEPIKCHAKHGGFKPEKGKKRITLQTDAKW